MANEEGVVTLASLRDSTSPFQNARLTEQWARLAFDAANLGAFLYDVDTGQAILDHTLQQMTGMTTGEMWFAAEAYFERIHPEDLGFVRGEIAASMSEGRPYSAEYRFQHPDGRTLWLAGRGDLVDTNGNGRVLAGVLLDVTALKQAETRATTVAREMTHRVRNIINVAQVMARMSGRTAQTLPDFLEKFDARLRALAEVNALAFHDGDDGISARHIIEKVLAPFQDDDRISIEAPDVVLNAALAETLALVLHELGTNAMKYGALSTGQGTVDVRFAIDLAADSLTLHWHETLPHANLAVPSEVGFGQTVLQRFASSVGGGAPEHEWRPNGLTYTCRWSLTKVLFEDA